MTTYSSKSYELRDIYSEEGRRGTLPSKKGKVHVGTVSYLTKLFLG